MQFLLLSTAERGRLNNRFWSTTGDYACIYLIKLTSCTVYLVDSIQIFERTIILHFGLTLIYLI